MPGVFTNTLAWGVIGLFTAGAVAERADHFISTATFSVAWICFGIFWAILAPHYIVNEANFVIGAGCLLAALGSLYVAVIFFSEPTDRGSLIYLSRAIAVMGLIYLPFVSIQPLRKFLVEQLSLQFHYTLSLLGYHPELTTARATGFRSAYIFTDGSGHQYRNFLILGCTGLGSISILTGLITTLNASWQRKVRIIAIVIPLIWILNLLRNVFIALAFGKQWFQIFVRPLMTLVGYTDPAKVSYFIADRVIAQSGAVLVLGLIFLFVSREMPELFMRMEGLLNTITKRQYDLSENPVLTGQTD